jgi:amino acid transporter
MTLQSTTTLKRSLNLPLLVLYGLGTTIGAGIYALTGKVAGQAGMLAPLSFGLAAVLAGFTAYSFAELSGRFPRAAAEAVYVREAFGNARFGTLVGLLVCLAGSVSAATISNGFAGYMNELLPAPNWVLLLGIVAVMCGLASWGIRESVGIAALLTLVELGGLFWILGVSGHHLLEFPARLAEFQPSAEFGWGGVMLGTLLAFYAFLGFEDMVNVAEETKDVRRALPLAIAITLGTTLLIYVLVALAAVLAVEPALLADSDAPLSFLVEHSTGRPALGISVVGVLASLGCLVWRAVEGAPA